MRKTRIGLRISAQLGIQISIFLILAGVGLIVWAFSLSNGIMQDLVLGLGVEMCGAVPIFILINLFFEGRKELEHEAQQKKMELIEKLGSVNNEVVLDSINRLGSNGWLTDGTLCYMSLHQANLRNAHLPGAVLQHVNLRRANLQNAKLHFANLEGADLSEADLSGASLVRCNLKAVDLNSANLRKADLRDADMKGANVWDAYGVLSAIFDNTTVLPNGNGWTPDTDMRDFTSPA